MAQQRLYTTLALSILMLTALPIGLAVFWLGFIQGDSPCVMCWEQRTGMALVALVGLFILRFGPRPKYVGLAVLVGGWGMFMGLRHTAMHAARDVGQGFSLEIMGAHTYTWALFIYWVCVITMGLLLMASEKQALPSEPRTLGPLESLAGTVFLVVIAANGVQAFASTGPPPYMGQSDPVRFSFRPSQWVWSLEEWNAAPISLRGRWGIEKPSLDDVPTDPAQGPLKGLRPLAIRDRRTLSLPLRGTPTDLAYDTATNRFLVTTQTGLYITDGSLGRIVRHTVVDTGFSIDLGRFAGAAFLERKFVLAMGENKSFVILREHDHADAAANYRFFVDAFDQFDEISRSRLGTVRARMMYTMSAAFDPAANSIYTVSVPNERVKRLVVSRFDRKDLTLSEEFLPSIAPDAGLSLTGETRSVDEYFVSGAAIADGKLYALSASYGTVLEIDLATHRITGAYGIAGLDHPVGLAMKGDDFYILQRDGRLVVVPRSSTADVV